MPRNHCQVIFSPDGRELQAGGWNGLAHGTIWSRHAFLYGFSPRHGLSGFMHELLRPGNVVALHSTCHRRFLRLDGEHVDGHGGHRDADDLPDDWNLERFTVVDAGPGQIALHSASHNRFVRIIVDRVDARGGVRNAGKLPDDWDSERLTVVDAGLRMIALHSRLHGRFLRMENGGAVNAWGARGVELLPNAWGSERFSVRLVQLA
ncbi:hypothetical protein FOA52_005620 [Chlamydomonas sp. UWO 241]|nr:hypothetical protein FOA52_005620 [Chlamydomonas sp. UWO 241]